MAATRKPFIAGDIATKLEEIAAPTVKWLAERGITANLISVLQFPFIALTLYFFIIENIVGVIISLIITLFLDVADGTFARVTGTTSKTGHLLDKTIDLISITVFVGGLIIYLPEKFFLLIVILSLSYIIYVFNEFTNIQIVGGVRSIGLVGLIIDKIELAIYLILIVSVSGLLYKLIELCMKNEEKK